ncbi:tRNA preQ1(34) S-adenosylmethionine ribosyltransferase-isomerase QueA [Parachlamydia sp. AcF125]|uniref:tRNA preQ1(34) S-adenosylmethionine ribosyltransferase-isomerase QueA n=1 Tax=Parachlamydia sp. AcF125 TaxID=2795736 RepID=UPI001BC9A2CF|nr:tRNA preQ1(34) S-adenosylmethionine ribosyltransferase-isomerase QueA [Parachlamydia sp. AcF125]MBS4168279.1 S-adenosylmethionine:tRNA ribosyltransferase-isomerase [Parachlamydia sp. AcF125]
MTDSPYQLSSYHFDLPPELIAQHPCYPRDHSRLMIVDRKAGSLSELPFYELPHLLQKGDKLIFNNTKVIPARLLGRRTTGGQAEVFLKTQRSEGVWEVLVKPGKQLGKGSKVVFSETFSCEVIEVLTGGARCVRFFYEGDFQQALEKHGKIPLPKYIKREPDTQEDGESYQTVYAAHPGAVAAPTAGLHFTQPLLEQLKTQGIERIELTLHVGLGTFLPIKVEDIRKHQMHEESFMISDEAAMQLNEGLAGRLICVGTTSCRALESAAGRSTIIQPGEYSTDIFISPGYKFRKMQALLTNFHLPCSSLLVLVSTFAGHELIREAYQKAVKEKFRFYSYGDAMLIL